MANKIFVVLIAAFSLQLCVAKKAQDAPSSVVVDENYHLPNGVIFSRLPDKAEVYSVSEGSRDGWTLGCWKSGSVPAPQASNCKSVLTTFAEISQYGTYSMAGRSCIQTITGTCDGLLCNWSYAPQTVCGGLLLASPVIEKCIEHDQLEGIGLRGDISVNLTYNRKYVG